MKYCFLLLIAGNGIFSCKVAEPETYLIPNGFTGVVNVIFNQVNGENILYENGRRIYKIPANGILLTKFETQEGMYNHKYYYYDSKRNKKTPLPIFNFDYNKDGTVKWLVKDSSEVGIFNDGTNGVYGGNMFRFQAFDVSDMKSLDGIESTQNNFLKKVKLILNADF
jgi:hypothetical protein